MLHVRCGDDILGKLVAAGLPGERLSWVDPVCEGPIPAGVEGAAWYAMRAAWLARRHRLEETEVAADLRAMDDALARAGEHDEVVLWFEHDFFDQAILVRLLAWWAAERPAARLTLVDVAPLLEAGPFIGLGALGSEELAGLFPDRREVTQAQLALGTQAWAALRTPDPTEVERVDGDALPYLSAALRRHLEELPWTHDGLSLGAQVLAGEDAVRLRGGLDRWVGGVHLEGLEPAWRWDGERGAVIGR